MQNDRKNCSTIHPVHTIHDRPEIVETKIRLGDFEGDTVYGGVAKGCVVTLVDRKSKLLTAAISVTRIGARFSIPDLKEVLEYDDII